MEAGEAYLPILDALGRLCREPGGKQLIALLDQYAPTWLVQMPTLVEDEHLETLQRKVHGASRERMLREMAEAMEALTTERPLVLVLEDLHWSDHFDFGLAGVPSSTQRGCPTVCDWNVSASRRHHSGSSAQDGQTGTSAAWRV